MLLDISVMLDSYTISAVTLRLSVNVKAVRWNARGHLDGHTPPPTASLSTIELTCDPYPQAAEAAAKLKAEESAKAEAEARVRQNSICSMQRFVWL